MKNIFIIVTLGCVVFGDTSEVKLLSVMEGDSVTLRINLTDIKQDEKIQWRFASNRLIAEIDEKKISYKESDERFRSRLELNIQTGDLTIKNMRTKYAGPYKAVISSTFDTPVNFDVKVNESAHAVSAGTDEETVLKTKGDSVTLNTGVQTQKDDLILWRFGDEGLLIAKDDKEDNKISIYDDEGFRDRLKLDDRTGSLIISGVTLSDSGLYKLKISSNSKQTLYKTFSVSVSDVLVIGGLSPGDKAGIVVGVPLVIAAAVAGVIYYRHRISKLQAVTVKDITAVEGECITLSSGVTKLQPDHEIEWRFGKEEIIAKTSKRDGKHILNDVDERFTDRLLLNDETGDLIILNIKTKHSGLYNLKVTSRTGTSCSRFSVMVYARNYPAKLGDLVTLTAEIPERKEVEQILWTFGDKDIRIARFIKEDNSLIEYYNYTDKRFKDKLKLDPKSGDLTITDITREHSGLYRQHVFCTNRTEYRKFNLFILLQAEEGKSFTLKTGVEIQKGDEVEWISPQKKITLASGIIGEKHIIKYTPDVRFRGRLEMNSDTGDLTISDVKETDFEEYILKQHRTEGNIGTRRKYMLNNIKVKAPGNKLNKQKPGMRGNQMAPDEGQPLNDV